jgi:hypothetical protein
MSKVLHSSVPVLLRYSYPYLQMIDVPRDVMQTVETHVTIGSEPLLGHLVAEIEFAEVIMPLLHKCFSATLLSD